jgi:tRNA G10  N-methylase Trm11
VLGVRFLRDLCKTERIVDPFCGVGTVLAVANALGVAAEGGDLSPQKADRASRLTLDEYLFGEREYEWGNYDDSASRG